MWVVRNQLQEFYRKLVVLGIWQTCCRIHCWFLWLFRVFGRTLDIHGPQVTTAGNFSHLVNIICLVVFQKDVLINPHVECMNEVFVLLPNVGLINTQRPIQGRIFLQQMIHQYQCLTIKRTPGVSGPTKG